MFSESGAIGLANSATERKRNRPFKVKSNIALNRLLKDAGIEIMSSKTEVSKDQSSAGIQHQDTNLPPRIQELFDLVSAIDKRLESIEIKMSQIDSLWQ